MGDRLFRSRDDRMLAGVAGGLAELWDADPALVRIVWALLMLFSGGLALVVYIVMAIVVPEEPWAATGSAPGPAGGSGPAGGFGPAAASGWTESGMPSREARREARAARRAARADSGARPFGLIAGLVLIGLGLFFLARQFLPRLEFDWVWPLILVGLGVAILVSALGRGRRDPGGRE